MTQKYPRLAAIALLLILSLQGLRFQWQQSRTVVGLDFYQFWVGARMAREVDDFYSPAVRKQMGLVYLQRARESREQVYFLAARERTYLDTLSTPMLYTVASVMRGTYTRDLHTFQIAMFLALITALVLWTRTHRIDPLLTLALFAILCIAFRPIDIDTLVVNVNKFLLLCVAASTALVAKRQYAIAAALLALATLMKPNILPVLPMLAVFLLVQRRVREFITVAMSGAVAAVIGILASSIYFGSWSIWTDWLREFKALPPSVMASTLGNLAVSRLIFDRIGFDPAPLLLIAFFALTTFAAWRARTNPNLVIAAIPMGCLVFLLGSPLLWVHYFLMALPAIALLLRNPDASEPESNVRRRFLVAALAVFVFSMDVWGGNDALGLTRFIFICNAGLVLLYIAALLDLNASKKIGEDKAIALEHHA